MATPQREQRLDTNRRKWSNPVPQRRAVVVAPISATRSATRSRPTGPQRQDGTEVGAVKAYVHGLVVRGKRASPREPTPSDPHMGLRPRERQPSQASQSSTSFSKYAGHDCHRSLSPVSPCNPSSARRRPHGTMRR
jgi:hypothetical protein